MARVARSSRVFSAGRRSSPYALILTALLALSMVLLMLLSLGILSLPINSDNAPKSHPHRSVYEYKEGIGERGQQWTEILSWEPRAFIYHNFLSKEECEYLIKLAEPHMAKSTVVDSATGKSKDSRVRTSSGMFLPRGRDKTIKAIEKRIADFTFIPSTGKGFRFSIMKLDKNMNLTTIISLMSSTLRMGGSG